MNELLKELSPSLIEIAKILLSALGVWVGLVIKGWINDKRNAEQALQVKRIIENTVMYVEQVAKNLNLDSAGKLQLAKDKALAYLNSKGLEVSEVELNVLIESTVKAFFGKWVEIGDPVDKLEEDLAEISKSAGTD